MKEKFKNFMQGRYGTDELSRFLLIVGIIFLLLDVFFNGHGFYLITMLILIVCYYRMLSRNYSRRSAENRKYLAMCSRLSSRFGRVKAETADRKENHIYRCPSCGQKIRIPRGKGNVVVTCPKCRAEFQKKS